MSEKKYRKSDNSFIIGLFVIIGSALVIGAIIWLGANQFLKEQNYYVTYFEGSVEGLESGSAVKYLGVPVGSVRKISVATDGKLVEVTMQVDPKIEIEDSLRVKVEMAGIAGGKFLQLYYPSNELGLYSYPKLDFETPYDVIKSAPSEIQEITLAMRDVMANLKQLEVNKISKGTIDFLNASEKMMESTDKFLGSEKLQGIIASLYNSSVELESILEKANNVTVLEDISVTSKNLVRSSEQLDNFVGKLNSEVDSINIKNYFDRAFNSFDTTMLKSQKTIDIIGYRTENLLFSINETFEQLKVTNKELQKALRLISDNPSQILLSEPPQED